jgi:NAD(P)-dependent dehydrogenase (short-subunit alcohol dehydrogenase family)
MTDTINSSKKVVLITGGNRGIGLVTARKLAERGCHVILTSRSIESGQAAVAMIQQQVPGAEVEMMQLDLASFASIHAFAEAFHATALPLDVLINNAGLMVVEKQPRFTADGFEMTFGTNHLGHFLLVHLLLPDLLRSAPSRLVVVASQTHIDGIGSGPGVDFDYDNLRAEKYYQPDVFYKNSKLANIWFAYELQRRLAGTGVTVNAVCPGYVPSTIAEHIPNPVARWMFKNVGARFADTRTVEEGAESLVFVALDPSLDGVGGIFSTDSTIIPSSPASYDEQAARRLWDSSLAMCGIEQYGQLPQPTP